MRLRSCYERQHRAERHGEDCIRNIGGWREIYLRARARRYKYPRPRKRKPQTVCRRDEAEQGGILADNIKLHNTTAYRV